MVYNTLQMDLMFKAVPHAIHRIIFSSNNDADRSFH